MGIKIKLVPHPSRRLAKLPDGRAVHHCDPCNEDVVEPKDHKKWQAILCDRCQGPTKPKQIIPITDQLGVEVEGKVVGLCHNGPDGFIAPTTKLDDWIWHEVKKYVDAKLGGSALLRDLPPPFPTEDEDEEEAADEDDTDLISEEDNG